MAKKQIGSLEEFDTFADKVLNQNEIEYRPLETVSSGILSLDMVTQTGGVPKRSIIQYYGTKGSGKTTLALTIAKSWLDQGEKVLFIDMEYSTPPEYLQLLLGDTYVKYLPHKKKGMAWSFENGFRVVNPNTLNEALDTIVTLVRGNVFGLIILDSIGGSLSKEIDEKDFGDKVYGMYSKPLTEFGHRIVRPLHQSDTTIIFLNQLRANMDSITSKWRPHVYPGGNALIHFLRIVIKLSPFGKVGGDRERGRFTRLLVEENKHASPGRSTEIPIEYGKVIDFHEDAVNFAKKVGIIEGRGSFNYFNGEKIGHGTVKTVEYLKENPDVLDKIVKACYNVDNPSEEEVINENQTTNLEE